MGGKNTKSSKNSSQQDSAEKSGVATVCRVEDLRNGEMKEFEIQEKKILVVKDDDHFYAIGSKCSHYGAPLVKGAYCNGRVRCPWHGACFNVKTGDIEDFPGLDGVPKFDVKVSDDGEVKIRTDKKILSRQKVTKSMCTASDNDMRTMLIIGGGPASVTCAETLRQEGYCGRIILATMEKYLPYHKPKLSKALNAKPGEILFRDGDFFQKFAIDIQLNKQAVNVNTDESVVKFSDGTEQKFTSLLVATGGNPRTVSVPGSNLKNIFTLRTPDDANEIADQSKDKQVVIFGSSFIGMEVASFLADKAAGVTVVGSGAMPFQKSLGDRIGTAMQKLHEEKGVKFVFNSGIKEFVGSDGRVKDAVLKDDQTIAADVVVLGIGVTPATDFLKNSGINMNGRGYVLVNKFMQTNKSNIYAAGDITEFPLFMENTPVNIQHFQMAHMQGRTAAYNILGLDKEIRSVPYFWTVQYGKSIRFTGYSQGYDDIIIHGDPNDFKFVAYYTKGDKVVAACSLAYDPVVSQVAEMMNANKEIKKSEIIENPTSWLHRLNA